MARTPRRTGVLIAVLAIAAVVVIGIVVAVLVAGGDDSSGGSPGGCPTGSAKKTRHFDAAPPMCIDVAKKYEAVFVTNKGRFTVTLDPAAAPVTVNSFVFLARYHYFDGTTCHRIIPGFVVQCGSPDASPNGGPGYSFKDELPAPGEYQLGSLAMANAGPNTNGSQFFIVTGTRGAALDPNFSLFGQVTDGFDSTVKAMEQAGSAGGQPQETITIQQVTIQES